MKTKNILIVLGIAVLLYFVWKTLKAKKQAQGNNVAAIRSDVGTNTAGRGTSNQSTQATSTGGSNGGSGTGTGNTSGTGNEKKGSTGHRIRPDVVVGTVTKQDKGLTNYAN